MIAGVINLPVHYKYHETMASCTDGFNIHNIHIGNINKSRFLLGESSTIDEVFLSGRRKLEGHHESHFLQNGNCPSKEDTALHLPSDEIKSLVPNGIANMEDETKDRDVFQGPSCYQVSLSSIVVISVICLLVVACRHYIKDMLLWMEQVDPTISCAIFLVLFTTVSFPMAWGYILLMVATGYLYGIIYGPLVAVICGGIGILVAHLVMKNCCKSLIMDKFYNDKVEAVIRVVESGQGFKVVALSRLTPIPFGLQNGLFALTDISLLTYIGASIIGLLPTAILNCYMGTTVRSMEDVLTDGSNQTTGYIIFIFQILLTVFLLWFVIRKARSELKKAVEGNGKDSEESIPLTEVEVDSS